MRCGEDEFELRRFIIGEIECSVVPILASTPRIKAEATADVALSRSIARHCSAAHRPSTCPRAIFRRESDRSPLKNGSHVQRTRSTISLERGCTVAPFRMHLQVAVIVVGAGPSNAGSDRIADDLGAAEKVRPQRARVWISSRGHSTRPCRSTVGDVPVSSTSRITRLDAGPMPVSSPAFRSER
jgi:hypothetical protein